jgi:transcription antitermination factor NusG
MYMPSVKARSQFEVGVPQTVLWFALTVRPQHEQAVAAQLQAKALESYVPVYRERHRWSDRVQSVELPLFPRYVFARFRLPERLSVLSIPSVKSIVSFGGKPCAVDPREIEAVQRMVASGMPVMPWPFLKIGQPVRLSGGAMDGLEGILVREKTGYRVVVNITILNRAVAVEIDRNHVKAVAGARNTPRCELHVRS